MWNVTEPFSEVDVAVFAEGTYPFARGGVSSVIHRLIEGSPDLSFGVIHLCWDGESPKEQQFDDLPNLRWVKTVFLAPGWGRSSRKMPAPMALDRKSFKQLKQVLTDLREGDYESLKSFYRRHPGWFRDTATESSPLLTHIPFLKLMVQEYFAEGLSYLDALWLSHEFTGLLTKLLAQDYPKAKIYHSHTNGYAGLAAILAKWQNGGKFLLSEHALYVRDAISFIPEPEPEEHRNELFSRSVGEVRVAKWEEWFRRLGHFVYEHIDASSYLYQGAFEEAKTYGYPEFGARPTIIPNGIDLASFEPIRAAQFARNEHRQDSSYIWTIGFIGRIVPIKGVLEFIDIIHDLAKRPDAVPFRVLVVGPKSEDPEYFGRCLAKIRKLGIEDLVFFTGTQNVLHVLSHIDVIALPSRSEAFPMVCLEAMASSIPIVANDVGCIRQILSGEPIAAPEDAPIDHVPSKLQPAGEIIPGSDKQLFSDRLHHLLTHRQTFMAYQKQGPYIVDQRYRSRDFLQRYRDLYQKLLGKPLLPAPKESPEQSLASYDYLKPNVLQGEP